METLTRGVVAGRERLGGAGIAGLALVVALAVRVAVWVHRGTVVQFFDYWDMLDVAVKGSGWPSVRGLVRVHNGHMVVVPKALYWVNTHLTGGSNIALGYLVVAVVVAQVAVLALLVPRRAQAHPVAAGALVVVSGALLLSPQGAWSFLLAMSGTAWLLANGFAIAAIWAARRGNPVLAAGAAALSALSYGTGVWAFPAALLVGVVASPRTWRRQWPIAAGGAVMAVVYLIARRAEDEPGAPTATVIDTLRFSARSVGSLVAAADGAAALWIGVLAMAAAGPLAVAAVRASARAAAPWVGVLAYGLLSTLAIAYGRAALFPPGTSRYSSLGALVWIGLAGLLVVVVGRSVLAAVPLAVLAVATTLHGGDQVEALHNQSVRQGNLANAFQVGAADGSAAWMPLGEVPHITGKLRSIGHHPFDGRWDGDCGLLGSEVDPDDASDLAAVGARGAVLSQGEGAQVRGTVVEGWVATGGREVRCLVATDAGGVVVGVGAHGYSRPLLEEQVGEEGIGFELYAPLDAGPLEVYAVLEGADALHVVPR